jgi:lysozyme
MNIERIIERIKEYEGYSDKPYQCTAKKWTVGFGYNYEDRGFTTAELTEILKDGFTKDIAEKLIAKDVQSCLREAEKFPWFKGLNEARAAVVIDMIYQLGITGFKEFKKTLGWLEKGNYRGASQEMVSSKWYTQSGRRSRTNVKQMDTGEWQEIQ